MQKIFLPVCDSHVHYNKLFNTFLIEVAMNVAEYRSCESALEWLLDSGIQSRLKRQLQVWLILVHQSRSINKLAGKSQSCWNALSEADHEATPCLALASYVIWYRECEAREQ